jgi:hypothetical protein
MKRGRQVGAVQMQIGLRTKVRQQRIDDDAHPRRQVLPVRVVQHELARTGVVALAEQQLQPKNRS